MQSEPGRTPVIMPGTITAKLPMSYKFLTTVLIKAGPGLDPCSSPSASVSDILDDH